MNLITILTGDINIIDCAEIDSDLSPPSYMDTDGSRTRSEGTLAYSGNEHP